MPYTSLVTIFALLVYAWTGLRVGAARSKYKIEAPATTGDPNFERIHRAQVNTTEQIILFLPSLWLFAMNFGDVWAALIGVVWPLARILYAVSYAKSADKRHIGFLIGNLASTALLLGALIAIIRDLLPSL